MSYPHVGMKTFRIELLQCPRLVGSYAPGKIFGNLVFASGQTPACDGALAYWGRVDAGLGVEEGYAVASEEFEAQPAVISRASDLLREIFGDSSVHACAAIGVHFELVTSLST